MKNCELRDGQGFVTDWATSPVDWSKYKTVKPCPNGCWNEKKDEKASAD